MFFGSRRPNKFYAVHRHAMHLYCIILIQRPPSVIPHAGITFGRSKRLKSQLYSPLIALPCCFEFIAASRGHIAPLASEPCPWDIALGYFWGYEMRTAENTPSAPRIHSECPVPATSWSTFQLRFRKKCDKDSMGDLLPAKPVAKRHHQMG